MKRDASVVLGEDPMSLEISGVKGRDGVVESQSLPKNSNYFLYEGISFFFRIATFSLWVSLVIVFLMLLVSCSPANRQKIRGNASLRYADGSFEPSRYKVESLAAEERFQGIGAGAKAVLDRTFTIQELPEDSTDLEPQESAKKADANSVSPEDQKEQLPETTMPEQDISAGVPVGKLSPEEGSQAWQRGGGKELDNSSLIKGGVAKIEADQAVKKKARTNTIEEESRPVKEASITPKGKIKGEKTTSTQLQFNESRGRLGGVSGSNKKSGKSHFTSSVLIGIIILILTCVIIILLLWRQMSYQERPAVRHYKRR